MRNQHARQSRTHLSRVNPADDEYDSLSACDQLRGFAIRVCAKFSRISKLLLNLPVLFQLRKVFRCADRSHDEWFVHCCLAKRFKFHPVARIGEFVEIGYDLVPAREFAIVTRRESKYFSRRENLCCRSDVC